LDKRKISQSPAFGRKVKKLKPQEKKSLDDAVLDIIQNPNIGQQKAGDLSDVFVYKFKINKQLILLAYTVTPIEICLIAMGSHENFYRDLKKKR